MSDYKQRVEMLDREKRPWRYDAEHGQRIPGPRSSCEYCDAGFLWEEDAGAVVVMLCPCQKG